MIKFEKQNFLGKNLVLKLLETGIDMGDSRYIIVETQGESYIAERTETNLPPEASILPTYTLPEIIYKLPEYVKEYGPLSFLKDAPFYMFYFRDKESGCFMEYPIESAALLLLECIKKDDLWYVKDIRGK